MITPTPRSPRPASAASAASAALAVWLVVLMLLAPVLVSVAHPLSPSAAAHLGAELFAVLWCLLGALAAIHAGRSVLARFHAAADGGQRDDLAKLGE